MKGTADNGHEKEKECRQSRGRLNGQARRNTRADWLQSLRSSG